MKVIDPARVTDEYLLDRLRREGGVALLAAADRIERLTAERDALMKWLAHEKEFCEAAGNKAGALSYARVIAKLEKSDA